MVLSYCTGIKTKPCALSPLLSKLAFQSHWMEQLWSHVKNQLELLQGNGIGKNVSSSHQLQEIHAFGSGATFCDLFVHHLLDMDDEEFLLAYQS